MFLQVPSLHLLCAVGRELILGCSRFPEPQSHEQNFWFMSWGLLVPEVLHLQKHHRVSRGVLATVRAAHATFTGKIFPSVHSHPVNTREKPGVQGALESVCTA